MGRVHSLTYVFQLINNTLIHKEHINGRYYFRRNLDEDVSFESFEYEDAEPTKLQRFFLTHKEINVSEFAKQIGINSTLLRNYINGFKKPSKERENEILQHIHRIGLEYFTATF